MGIFTIRYVSTYQRSLYHLGIPSWGNHCLSLNYGEIYPLITCEKIRFYLLGIRIIAMVNHSQNLSSFCYG